MILTKQGYVYDKETGAVYKPSTPEQTEHTKTGNGQSDHQAIGNKNNEQTIDPNLNTVGQTIGDD
jgi:hypothetical protein